MKFWRNYCTHYFLKYFLLSYILYFLVFGLLVSLIKFTYALNNKIEVVSLDFSVTYSFRPFRDPGVDSTPSKNEYQEHFLEIKAAGA